MKLPHTHIAALLIAFASAFAVPAIAHGAGGETFTNILLGANTPTNALVSSIQYQKNLGAIIANILGYILGFLGIIAVCLVVYAGFMWLTAGGEEEKAKQALKLLSQAVIGLAIVMSAWSISFFVISALIGSIKSTP